MTPPLRGGELVVVPEQRQPQTRRRQRGISAIAFSNSVALSSAPMRSRQRAEAKCVTASAFADVGSG